MKREVAIAMPSGSYGEFSWSMSVLTGRQQSFTSQDARIFTFLITPEMLADADAIIPEFLMGTEETHGTVLGKNCAP